MLLPVSDVEDDVHENLPEPLVNDDDDDDNDDGGGVQQLIPENNTPQDQPKKQLPTPQDGHQGRRSRTKDPEKKDDAADKKTKTIKVQEKNGQKAGTSQESTTKDQHQIGKPHGHDVTEKCFEELRQKRKLLEQKKQKKKQIEEKEKREEMEKTRGTEEDANEANGTSGTTNDEAPTPDPQQSNNSLTKKRAPTEGGEGAKTVDPLEIVKVQLATTRPPRKARKRGQGQGQQAVVLTTHDLYVEHYRRGLSFFLSFVENYIS